jgi:ATP-dependent RNA helicase DDX5/DBP2
MKRSFDDSNDSYSGGAGGGGNYSNKFSRSDDYGSKDSWRDGYQNQNRSNSRDRHEKESYGKDSYGNNGGGARSWESNNNYSSSSYDRGDSSGMNKNYTGKDSNDNKSSIKGNYYSDDRPPTKFDSSEMGSKLKEIDWDLSKLPKFEKNFYVEHRAVARRSENSADDWRNRNHITCIGRGIPKVSSSVIRLNNN